MSFVSFAVSLCIVAHLHMSSGTLTERRNFSKNGLALANLRVNSSKNICQIHLIFWVNAPAMLTFTCSLGIGHKVIHRLGRREYECMDHGIISTDFVGHRLLRAQIGGYETSIPDFLFSLKHEQPYFIGFKTRGDSRVEPIKRVLWVWTASKTNHFMSLLKINLIWDVKQREIYQN